MIEDAIILPPELLAFGIGPGASRTLRREMALEGINAAPLLVSASVPPNEIHVYQNGELKTKITGIGE